MNDWLGGDTIVSIDINLTRKDNRVRGMNVKDEHKQLIDQLQRVIDIVVKNNIIDETMEFEAYEQT